MKVIATNITKCSTCPKRNMLDYCFDLGQPINYEGIREDCPLKELTEVQLKAIEQILGRKCE